MMIKDIINFFRYRKERKIIERELTEMIKITQKRKIEIKIGSGIIFDILQFHDNSWIFTFHEKQKYFIIHYYLNKYTPIMKPFSYPAIIFTQIEHNGNSPRLGDIQILINFLAWIKEKGYTLESFLLYIKYLLI